MQPTKVYFTMFSQSDTLHKIASNGGDPASSFLNFIWNNYVSSGTFWGMIIIVFFLLWVGRIFIFDNKNIKLNDKSWFYPLSFFVIVFLAVWLKSEAPTEFTKKYISDLITTMGVIAICYIAFGHKLITWLSKWAAARLGLQAGYEKKGATLIEEEAGKKVTTEITQTQIKTDNG